MMREILILHSQDELCEIFLVLLEIFNFWSKFLNFKGVSPRKKIDKSKIKFKILKFHCMMMDVLMKHSQDELCEIFLVLLEIFEFWSKFLNFKGVSPRKK